MKFAGGLLQCVMIVLGDVAVTHFETIDARSGAEQAIAELERRHFQADNQRGFAELDADVLNDVERESGFAHARAGGENCELTVLQATGFIVVIVEAGFDATETVFVLHPRIEPRKAADNDIANALGLCVALRI